MGQIKSKGKEEMIKRENSDEKNHRNKVIQIRLTESEYQLFRKNADARGMSFFLRDCAMREIATRKNMFVKQRERVVRVTNVINRYQDVDPKLLFQLGKIGNNVMQIARAVNIIRKYRKDFDVFVLQEAVKDVQKVLIQIRDDHTHKPEREQPQPQANEHEYEDIYLDLQF